MFFFVEKPERVKEKTKGKNKKELADRPTPHCLYQAMNRTSVRIIIIDIMLAERYRSYQDNDYYYCLKSYSQISDITVRKTSIIGDGRAFLLEP